MLFAERRAKFLDAMEDGAVAILVGAELATRSNDTHYPFRQDSDFHYLTGFDHPGATAVFRKGADPSFCLFVEPRDPAAETWTGFRPGIEGARSDFGADAAYPREELLRRLPELVQGAPRLYHVLGRVPKIDALLFEGAESARMRSRAGVLPPEAFVDPRSVLHEMRLRKDDEELDMMRRAAEISRVAHAAAAGLAREGTYEYELEAALNYHFRRLGAGGPAYDSIVGSGANATVLHYIKNDAVLRDGDSVLIDAGCELEGYASDVTRVYPVGGAMRGPVRDLYEVVLRAQQASLEVSRPGATLENVHEASLRELSRGLIDLGILNGDLDTALGEKRYERFYMHRTSHWLGLDVHDAGAYIAGGTARSLEPRMAYTVEPGLYIAANDQQAPEAFRGIGIRIEDDVVITDDHHENLTSAIPKTVDDVEALVREGIA